MAPKSTDKLIGKQNHLPFVPFVQRVKREKNEWKIGS